MRSKIILFIVFTGIVCYNGFTQGCSQCKLLSEQGSELEESSFGSNMNVGILFLMIIPYLILMFLFREQIKKVFMRIFSKQG
jgi:hypothetical protein